MFAPHMLWGRSMVKCTMLSWFGQFVSSNKDTLRRYKKIRQVWTYELAGACVSFCIFGIGSDHRRRVFKIHSDHRRRLFDTYPSLCYLVKTCVSFLYLQQLDRHPGAMGEVAMIWEGRPVAVKLSDNETGYLNVLMQKDSNRKKPYYAKFDPGDGSKQKTLNGSSSTTAQEAACKLAYFLAGHAGPAQPRAIRAPRRSKEVCPPCHPIRTPTSFPLLHSLRCACMLGRRLRSGKPRLQRISGRSGRRELPGSTAMPPACPRHCKQGRFR